MKKLLYVLALIVFSVSAYAQAPIEGGCPAGSGYLGQFTARDSKNNTQRVYGCIDSYGNITWQLGTFIGTTPSVINAAGRWQGIGLNFSASGSAITGFRGIDSRVSDATTSAEVVGIQGLGTKTAGDSAAGAHSLWGGNFIANLTGGKTSNIYGAYGEADIGTGATITNSGGGAFSLINGLQGYVGVNSGATLTNAYSAGVVGIAGQLTGDAKATAGVFSILEGATSQATTGVGALFKGGNFNNQAEPDYGLDFDTTLNSVALAFAKAEVRFSGGQDIFTGAQTTRTGVYGEVDGTAAIGSFYLSTAGKMYLKVSNGGASTDWQRVTTTAAD